MNTHKIELTEREISIAICSLTDYEYQFVNDDQNKDLLKDIMNLASKLNEFSN